MNQKDNEKQSKENDRILRLINDEEHSERAVMIMVFLFILIIGIIIGFLIKGCMVS